MKNPLLMWILLGVGVILVYAAWKGKSPKQIVSQAVGQ